jgi:DNA-binding beta-propeller fold protein YncE
MKARSFQRWARIPLLLLVWASVLPARAAFVTFESGQVRPLALSPDGSRLFALNTPDNRLEIFAVDGSGLALIASVAVGLEPVAVAARTNNEVWVVNHLSDSISIVELSATPPRVVRTLLVGDEPRDIVFAGPGGNRAFITTAHRGQNNPNDPQLTTAGIGRADVWVFDATNLGSTLGGTPLTIVTLFGDTPRALAVSPDGATVYAAVFHSGNRTTALNEGLLCDTSQANLNNNTVQGSCTVSGTTMPGGLPLPHRDTAGEVRPETGLIVKFNGTNWVDQLGRNWNNAVRFNLPDRDVFKIDANANPPVAVSGGSGSFVGVGTVLFNMVANPVSGKVYVTNTDARNEVRFEGPGSSSTTVQGRLHEARITVLDGTSVLARHLNKHINYSLRPAPAGTKEKSLATPLGMAVSGDGATLYVAAFGSSKVGVFSTAEVENNTFTPNAANHIIVSGGGPSGLVLDEVRGRLYVLTRFDNGISIIDTATRTEVDHLLLYNPEPASVVNGRRFLYDAFETSSNGEAACASCHIFGDLDSLAWDLGNPDDVVMPNGNPFRLMGGDNINCFASDGAQVPCFHPMKGPMTTQSLRGMANQGPMHWRGDRTGASDGGSGLDEVAAFKAFNVAFAGLLGRTGPLADAEMQAFADFILQVTYPPNPIRALDNSLTANEQAGSNFFFSSAPSDVAFNCDGCHKIDRGQGAFGTDGFSSFEGEPQEFKIPHFRNLYQKVGMFGMPAVQFFNAGDNGNKGDQIRGFGFLHDGSVDTLFRFHNAVLFNQNNPLGLPNPGGFPSGTTGNTLRQQVERFLLAADSDLFPIVGQQITLTSTNSGVAGPRINLLIARAAAGECDLVVRGAVNGEERGWYRTAAGTFQSDRSAEVIADASLRALAANAGQELTYSAVPPGSGVRIGVDRDEDGFYDRDEIDDGTDPANPNDPTPPTATATPSSTPTGTPTSTNTPVPTGTSTHTPTATMPPTETPTPSSLCASGATITGARLLVSNNSDPAGDEKLTASGQVQVMSLAPPINPPANGFTFYVRDLQGAVLLTRTIPAGPIVQTGIGWRRNASGSKWTYKDANGTQADGVTQLTITRSSTVPGGFRFRIKGKNNLFQVDPGAVPVQLQVILSGTRTDTNLQCGTLSFQPEGGVRPRCRLLRGNDLLNCS